MSLIFAIKIVQIVLTLLLIFLILIQSKGIGLSSVFGGSGPSFYRTRRGLEKFVFTFTIIISFLFVLNSLFIVILS